VRRSHIEMGRCGIRKKLLRKRLNLVVMPLLILLLAALCVYLRPGDNAMRGAAMLAEGSHAWERRQVLALV
jgi:SNF family Na+-dependent transporter